MTAHGVRAIWGAGPFGREITCECGAKLPISWEDPVEVVAKHAAEVENVEMSLACGCKWTPGIDLPTTECERHANDPDLAHGGAA